MRDSVSVDPAALPQPPPGLPTPEPIVDLDVARRERGAERDSQALLTMLETERSANRALLSAIPTLETRLATERGSAARFEAELKRERGAGRERGEALRAELDLQRRNNEDMWEQVIALNGELALAARPLWRKLLRRR